MLAQRPRSEFDAIASAREVIAARLHRTPLSASRYLGELTHTHLFFKQEMFQKTGSFKIRGVLNKLDSLSAEERQRGVIGMSSGNHAQALAYGASLHGIAATIVMPSSSVASKVEATRNYGSQVHLTDEGLLETYRRIQQERGLTPVHPFDDPKIVAGAGTVGLEIVEDVAEVDYVLVSVGGGGLISGVATAVKHKRPEAKVIGVEPEGAAVVSRSLAAGHLVTLDHIDTIADGLCPPFTGEVVLDRIQRYVDEVVTVSDREVLEAMRLILERTKVVAEPSAAASFAALLSGKIKPAAGAVAVSVLSGGNIDSARLKALL
jgi:threonine dehydratase